ncbi:MAG TPA: tRNA lysidine(34) synthetase TilS [Lysobacter sp.]|nr:tRNA lysidine(34) synthetase TilS [Lysobacter sp.]
MGLALQPPPHPVERVAVGFSGGLDSSVLLHALQAQGHAVRALHVNHGLHGDADRWAQHCAAVCAEWRVPLQVVGVRVERDGEGLEAAARRARYAAFAEALADGEVLALAHHRDDQAETFLLRALRGAGVDGLAAMRPWRPLGHGWLWRPLLAFGRDALLAYAQAHGLRWIDDPSNADLAFERNFLRHRLMPLLRERWPQADTGLTRAATLAAEAATLLDLEDTRALAEAATADPHALSRTALARLPTARRARVLRRWIAGLGLPPLPAAGVDRIERELLDARTDAGATFAWHGAAVRAWRDLLHASRLRAPLPPDWEAAWDGRAPLALPDGGTLTLDGASGFDAPLRVRARRGGERIVLPGRAHSHALKHVLQELGVPPWERAHLPLLCDDAGTVLAAGDLVHAAAFGGWLRVRRARLHWTPPD